MHGCKNLAAIGLPPYAVIFVRYREVSTRTILPNFIDLFAEAALYLRSGGHKGGVVKGEKGGKRKRTSSIRFSRATKKVLARSHSRSLQLLPFRQFRWLAQPRLHCLFWGSFGVFAI